MGFAIKVIIAILLSSSTYSIISCKTRSVSTVSAIPGDVDYLDFARNPQELFSIDRMMGDGDTFEITVNEHRPIEQITMKYHGDYSIPVIKEDGEARVNDEGKTYFKDGMYVTGYIKNSFGRSNVSTPKFIDAYETDNWYDLGHIQGSKLLFEFHYRDSFRDDPAVKSSNRKIKMESVLVRYHDPEGLQYEEKVFNHDDENPLSKEAKSIDSGEEFVFAVPGDRRIFRVDIRWGDAKPRKNGVYVPGYANGQLIVNQKKIGEKRNVAAIENQIWIFDPQASVTDHEIKVQFFYDIAKIHWIKVYYL